jgi:hypothetical protein
MTIAGDWIPGRNGAVHGRGSHFDVIRLEFVRRRLSFRQTLTHDFNFLINRFIFNRKRAFVRRPNFCPGFFPLWAFTSQNPLLPEEASELGHFLASVQGLVMSYYMCAGFGVPLEGDVGVVWGGRRRRRGGAFGVVIVPVLEMNSMIRRTMLET